VRGLEGVVADVPDLRPWLWGAAVYACPMDSGTGIKNKLLEAMAAGAPAVATTLACQGIDRSDIVVADSDAAFAAALVAALREPERSARRAEAAREYVRARHDWDAVASSYLALFEAVARR
jgi:glycosyltransferase involved in cell wall biosynthesis